EVLDVDLDRERVSLSLKATQEDPWRQFARTHQIGQVVPGKVTKLVPFGAFVRVDEGIEGLVHISKQANEGVVGEEDVFDPAAYGMAASYDEQGNYIYPEGFDPETGEWREGFESQREEWE